MADGFIVDCESFISTLVILKSVLKIVPWDICYRATTTERIVSYICIKVWRIRNNITYKRKAWLFENRSVFSDRTKVLIFNINYYAYDPFIYA